MHFICVFSASQVQLVDKICDAVLSGRVLIFCSVAGRKALDQHLKEKYVPLETNRENVTGYSTPRSLSPTA